MTHTAGLPIHAASQAFDGIADSYDELFTRTPIGRAQRRAVWKNLLISFRPGERVLELNCGTGEDAFFLSRAGVSVVACDASARMIEIARRKQISEEGATPVEFHVLRTEEIRQLRGLRPFDGVLSNFSGLNCIEDLNSVASDLAKLTRPGANVCICLSSRLCLWETVWFALHGNFRKALRRVRGSSVAKVADHSIEVWYPSIRAVKRSLAGWFRLRSIRAVGLSVPPSYVQAGAITRRQTLDWLEKLDEVVGGWPFFRTIGDHVLLTFERALP